MRAKELVVYYIYSFATIFLTRDVFVFETLLRLFQIGVIGRMI